MSMLAGHVRFALRTFRKNPGFTAIAVTSLALGIGANTAIFSLLDRVLLRTLPVRDPGELVLLTANGPRSGNINTQYDDKYTFSYPMFQDFRDRAPVFSGAVAWSPAAVSFSAGGHTERVTANLVSGSFFEMLGVKPALGRPILPGDARATGSSPVAVLSYRFWQRRFGGEPGILNQTVTINSEPITIVGVAARGFEGLAVGEAPAFFVPLTMTPRLFPENADIDSRRVMWLNVMCRLRPGVSPASAESAMNVFWKPILEEELKAMPRASATFRERFLRRHLSLEPAASGISALRPMFKQPLALLMGLVGLVLLIACANVANLLIARAAGRQREIAIRLAVGANRRDIVQQILVESLALAVAGGALGIALATWAGQALLGLLPFGDLTRSISAVPDWRILLFTGLVSIVCGLVFGLLPALQTTRPDLAITLKEQAGSVLSSQSHVRFRKTLVIAQMALSLLLLTGAGLFLRSLSNLRNIDFGFRAERLMVFAIQPSLNGYSRQRAIALFDGLRERIGVLPGVSGVALSQTALLADESWVHAITIPGREPKDGETAPDFNTISSGYFSAIGTPLLAGREFTRADAGEAPRVAIVNEFFARYYFGGANAVGRQFLTGSVATSKTATFQIVGVVKEGKYTNLREKPQPFVFLPYAQEYSLREGAMNFYVRASRDAETLAASLRETVRQMDPNLPVFEMKTMQRQIDDSVFADRTVSALSSFFGLLATLLAAIGLYGVMSYTVTRRTRELGIRIALGAARSKVLTLIMKEVAILAASGIAIAIPLSTPLAKLAKSMLYQVAPDDARVLTGSACLLALVALAAGCIPAWRATRIDPLRALRHE